MAWDLAGGLFSSNNPTGLRVPCGSRNQAPMPRPCPPLLSVLSIGAPFVVVPAHQLHKVVLGPRGTRGRTRASGPAGR